MPYLGRVDRVGVVGVHDSGVIENHVGSTPAILSLNSSLHVRLLGHVAADGLQSRCSRHELLHLGESLG